MLVRVLLPLLPLLPLKLLPTMRLRRVVDLLSNHFKPNHFKHH